MTIRRFGEICLTWIRRTQVVLAYVTVLSGMVVYTVNSSLLLLVELINRECVEPVSSQAAWRTTLKDRSSSGKLCSHHVGGGADGRYGVSTFARYLGAYVDLGWTWNRRPPSNHVHRIIFLPFKVLCEFGFIYPLNAAIRLSRASIRDDAVSFVRRRESCLRFGRGWARRSKRFQGIRR